MKSFKTIAIIIIVIVVLIGLKLIFFPGKKPETPDPKKMAAMAVPVSIYVAKEEPVSENLVLTGSVLSNEEVELKPEASGKITHISFKEGGDVTEGQLLVKINDSDLRAQLVKIEHQLKLARDKESRYKELLKVEGVSREEYEGFLSEVNVLNSEKDFISAQIRKTEIRAPFSGTIGLKHVSVGDVVSPATIVASLQQIDPVKIEFSVPERYATQVRSAENILFTVENLNDTFSAKIFAIEPRIDESTRSVLIRALCPNKEKKILPGAFAHVKLELGVQTGIMIPTESVIPEFKGKKIFVVKGGKAEAVMVETGIRDESGVQILNNIQKGDTVVVTGIMQLRPGSKVKITEVRKEI